MAALTVTLGDLMILYELNEGDCSKPISRYHLDEISRTLCGGWRSLPTHLSMPEIVVKDLERDFKVENERRNAFFFQWKGMQGSAATYKKLIIALLDIKCREDAEGVCNLLALQKFGAQWKCSEKISPIAPGTAKPAGSLVLDPSVQEDLEYLLEINLEAIEKLYATYVSYIYDSIEEMNVSVKKLRMYLLNLPALNCDKSKDEQQYKLLSGVRDKLHKASTVEDIFFVLSIECASFLNYDIFESIQKKYKIADSTELKYPEDLKAYIYMHKVSEFVKVNPKLAKFTASSETVVLKFDIPITSKIAKVLDLKKALAKILRLNPSALRLLSIKEGCVEATFLIPSDVADFIFKEITPRQLEEIQALPVMWLKCGDHKFSFVRETLIKSKDGSQFSDMSQQVISEAMSLCGDITQNITSDKLKALEDRAQLLTSESDLDRARPQEHRLQQLQRRHQLRYHLDYSAHNQLYLGHDDIDRCDQHLELDEIILLSTGNLKYASCVFLNNCNIGDKGCEILAGGFADCKSLKRLALRANAISDVGAKHLAKVSISLQSLDLSYNRIGDHGAIVLAKSLQNLPGLETLDLRYNFIGDEGAIALAKSIRIPDLRIWNYKISQSGADSIHSHNPAIDEPFGILILHPDVEMSILANNIQESPEQSNIIVLISDNMLSNKDSIKIIEHCHNLQSLIMHHCIHHDVKALADGLKHCTSLRTLNLSDNSICDDGCKGLADGLKHCTSLRTLNLSYSSIGNDGVKALADELKHCTSLQTLNLAQNYISNDGVKVLADKLKLCTSLQTLNLSANGIGNDGVKALADGLKHCTSLQTLNLSYSSIGNDGVKALADKLKYCTSLQTLDLSANDIGNDGVKALADGLKHCTSLQTLNFAQNYIGNDGVKALADELKHCTSLQILDLSANDIGNDSVKALADGLKHCTSLQRLILSKNDITDTDYIRAIVNQLEHCTIVDNYSLWGH